MFTSEDIEEVKRTIEVFPVATKISIAKISDNTVEYYGVRKTKNHQIETIQNEHSIFEIGSITKLFTSAILAQMSVEHLIDMDEKIDIKLGFPLKDNLTIAYKELSTHSSGLPRISFGLLAALFFGKKDNPYRDYSEEKLINYLKTNLKLRNKGRFRYSNLGAGLLGYVLSKYSEQSYDELLKERLFIPLNMNESTTIREEIKETLVTGLDKKGKPAKNWDLNVLAGAGAALSSTADLSKFLLANIRGDNEALNYQRRSIFKNGNQSMGLGWFILKNRIPNIDEAYFHNGGTGGYRSSMVADFNNGCGVVVLSNVSGLYLFKGNKIDHLSFNILKNMR